MTTDAPSLHFTPGGRYTVVNWLPIASYEAGRPQAATIEFHSLMR